MDREQLKKKIQEDLVKDREEIEKVEIDLVFQIPKPLLEIVQTISEKTSVTNKEALTLMIEGMIQDKYNDYVSGILQNLMPGSQNLTKTLTDALSQVPQNNNLDMNGVSSAIEQLSTLGEKFKKLQEFGPKLQEFQQIVDSMENSKEKNMKENPNEQSEDISSDTKD